MQFEIFTSSPARITVDCLVVGVHDGGELSAAAAAIDRQCNGALGRFLKRGDFPGRLAETLLLPAFPRLKATRLLLVGQGGKEVSRRSWRRALAAAVGALSRTKVASAAVALTRPEPRALDDYLFGRSAAETAHGALYRVNDLKSGTKAAAPALSRLVFGPVRPSGAAAARRGLVHGQASGQGARLMRDLANLPGNVCTPSYLAEQSTALAARFPSIRVRVLEEADIRAEKMGCFLAVTQGSDQPPKFIVIEYKASRGPRAPIVLVGKGITFDTGGISLKDPGAMDEMKFDMSGAAAVIATIAAESKASPVRLRRVVSVQTEKQY